MHIFIKPPPNLRQEGMVWKLRKALYGLRVAPWLFQEFMARKLIEPGSKRMISDPQLYVHTATGALASIHADDILLTAPKEKLAEIQKRHGHQMGRSGSRR